MAIEARAVKATPGPWAARSGESGHESVAWYIGDDGGDGPSIYVGPANGSEAYEVVDDAAFIAHARDDVPKLVDEVRHLQERQSWFKHECWRAREERDEAWERLKELGVNP